jgi:hypothetical protein
MFAGALGNLAESITVDGKTGEAALDIVASGRVSFLFHENGAVRCPDPAWDVGEATDYLSDGLSIGTSPIRPTDEPIGFDGQG